METKKSRVWFVLGALALAAVLLLGNFHVVTGSTVGLRVVARQGFGFGEIFVNVDQITSMPWLVAQMQFPISCSVVQREGLVETNAEFLDGVLTELEPSVSAVDSGGSGYDGQQERMLDEQRALELEQRALELEQRRAGHGLVNDLGI